MTPRVSFKFHITVPAAAASAAAALCEVAAVYICISPDGRGGARRRGGARNQQHMARTVCRKIESCKNEAACCCCCLLLQLLQLAATVWLSWDSDDGTAVSSAAAGVAGWPLLLVRCVLVVLFCVVRTKKYVCLGPPAPPSGTARKIREVGLSSFFSANTKKKIVMRREFAFF